MIVKNHSFLLEIFVLVRARYLKDTNGEEFNSL
jgi:hypothetical protein